jgi:hypothetical protein
MAIFTLEEARALLPRVKEITQHSHALVEELREPLVDRLLDKPPNPGVPELRLGLPLELRVAQLDRHDRGQALADVFALEVVFLVLDEALALRVAVEHVRE